MNKFRAFIAVFVVLILAIGVLAFGLIGNYNTANNYAVQLEGVYQRSFYELLSNVNNMEVNLSKALVSSDRQNLYNIFEDLYDECTTASSNLSRLPINHQSIKETTKLVNQLGGFCYYLCKKMSNGQDMSSSDYSSVEQLYDNTVYIQKTINEFVNNLNGDYKIIDDAQLNDENTDFDSMFSSMQSGTTEYPTLIYDGPFSESVTNKTILGLPETTITKQEAESKIYEIFGSNITNLNYNGLTNGNFETYNYEFKKNNNMFYVQITKRGGFLLAISSYEASGISQFSLTACEQKAEEFALSIGLENIKSVWSTKLNGVAYVNLTTVLNNVTIYPEMIKVKVSCSSGEILGWEAQAYAYNHQTRNNLTATVGATTAREKVSTKLTVLTVKLAIIPQEFENDTLVYEFKCGFNNYIYYVYIDALTGIETQVLRVVSTTDGDLLM